MTDITNAQILLIDQRKKSAIIATVLNVVWLGLGCIYTGQWLTGLGLMFIILPLLLLLSAAFPLCLLFVLVLAVIIGISSTNEYNCKMIEEALK